MKHSLNQILVDEACDCSIALLVADLMNDAVCDANERYANPPFHATSGLARLPSEWCSAELHYHLSCWLNTVSDGQSERIVSALVRLHDRKNEQFSLRPNARRELEELLRT